MLQGMDVHGVCDYVICGGRVVVDEGQLKTAQGMGRFIPTPTYAPHVYMRLKEREKVTQYHSQYSFYLSIALNKSF